jgi:hypothetical protein
MRRRGLIALAPLGLLLALVVSAPAGAKSLPIRPISHTSAVAAEDDEVVLPSRVANAIARAQKLLDAAGTSVDTGDTVKAVASLKAVHSAILRADRAARAQMNAPVDPNAEEGSTTGPDSVIAVLTLDQTAVTTIAGLFDTKSGLVVDSATHALFGTMNTRDKLLNAVIALPAEGAGADYSDGMADTVTGYDDEVANLSEALSSDKLSVGGQKVLTAALAQSKKTQAAATAAFGGGE